jgi:hypothetical protein
MYRKVENYDPAKGSVKTWILQYAYHRSLNRQKYLNLRSSYDAGRRPGPMAITAIDQRLEWLKLP